MGGEWRQKLNTVKGPGLDPWKVTMQKWESSNEVCSLVNSFGTCEFSDLISVLSIIKA